MIFCPLYSGSSGNSVFVSSGNTKILVDAGLAGKRIENGLKAIGENPSEIDAILVTHEHIDHIKGVGVLSRRYDIPIYTNEATWNGMLGVIGKISDHNIKIISNNYINIKDMDITSYSIPHDAADPCGYSIVSHNKKVCIATDLGYFSKEVCNAVKDCNAVLLESNHDVEMLKFGPYPYSLKKRILSKVGHLSNTDCGKAALCAVTGKCKKIILGHLSKVNNYPELAYKTVENIFNENGIKIKKDIELCVAKRDMPSGYTEI